MNEETRREIEELKNQLEVLESLKDLKEARCCYCGEKECEIISIYTGKPAHVECHANQQAGV